MQLDCDKNNICTSDNQMKKEVSSSETLPPWLVKTAIVVGGILLTCFVIMPVYREIMFWSYMHSTSKAITKDMADFDKEFDREGAKFDKEFDEAQHEIKKGIDDTKESFNKIDKDFSQQEPKPNTP